MRLFPLAIFGLILLFSIPSFAGNATFTNGRGGWQSTQCTPPQAPSALNGNPEERANNLNAQWTMHNQFAAAAQNYMTCISNEAQQDSAAASQMITNAAQGAIQQMDAAVAADAASLQRQSAMAR